MDKAMKADNNKFVKPASEEFIIPKRHHWLLDILIQLVRTKPLGAFGGFLVLILVLAAILAPWISSFPPNEILGEKNIILPPSGTHFFGTDPLARDLFSRIVYGARISLEVGFGAVLLSIFVATIAGVLSGYFGGIIDIFFQRIADAIMSIPWLIFLLSFMAIMGPGLGNLIIGMGIIGSATSSRVIRGAVIAIKEGEYFLAARATGCKRRVILLHHVLPNVAAPIIVLATLGLGNVILAEAALSFLGLGVPPPAPSWGRALSGEGLQYMLQAPWLAIFPGLAISIAVFGFNMLGDALRDLLDPKLQGVGR
jgi:peptide/nickel transport system permease protein